MRRTLTSVSKIAAWLPLKWTVFPLIIAVVLVWAAAATTPDSRLHVFFLDVGQGDAILIRTPSQRQILIDGGPSPEAITNELGPRLPFWDRTIDLVVLTHPHDDHIAGLVEVLRRYQVRQVLESGMEHDSPAYDEWLKLIEDKGIERTIARAGLRIELGDGVRLDVLHPQADMLQGTSSDIDNNSMVLRLVYGQVSFLFTADIHQEAERFLVGEGAELQSGVLKVPHHGSDTSSSAQFLEAVEPQLAVISVGADNRFGHPHDDTVARLAQRVGAEGIYCTDEKGAIELISDGHRIWLKAER